MDRTEEYTSDEGNYSSISSTSGLSTYDEELSDFRGLQPTTDSEKQQLLLHNKNPREPKFLLSCSNLNTESQYGNEGSYRNRSRGMRMWSRLQYESTTDNNEKLIVLQNLNQEICKENDELQKENNDFKHQLFLLQRNDKQLKQDLYQLNIDKECRESCILHLKEKIKEQQAEIQTVLQQNFKSNIELSNYQNELTTIKGTIEWYKTQWQTVNTEKNILLQKSLELKNTFRSQKLEINRLEALLNEFKQQQHKTNSCKSRSYVEKTIDIKEAPPCIVENESSKLSEYYLGEIEALNREINIVKETLSEQTEVLTVLVKEKGEILQNHVVLQKTYEETEQYLQTQIGEKQAAHKTNASLMANIIMKDQQLLEMKTQITNMTIELAASLKEKQLVQESINKTRNSFHKLLSMQEALKEDLKQKDKMILSLEKKMQDNFMHESWNKCANEELVSKEAAYLKRIQDVNKELTELKKDMSSKVEENGKLMFELEEIKKYCKTVSEHNEMLSKEVAKYKIDVINGCKQIECLTSERNEMLEVESLHADLVRNLRTLCSKYGLDANVNINQIVHKIENYLYAAQSKKAEGGCNCKQLIKEIETRCVNVAKKCSMAENLTDNLREEIFMLRDKIHVKEMDLCNKQKRYELYYRTLLKKVKEQKHETQSMIKENNNLKEQQHFMMETMNTMQLQLSQAQINIDNANCKLLKKTETIKELQVAIKNLLREITEKSDLIADLESKQKEFCHKYDKLVSTHSNCSRDGIETETDAGNLQEKLDFSQNEVKIANCTFKTNTQNIELLKNNQEFSLKLIPAMEMTINEYAKQVRELMKERQFLQRLIIDLKSALNASTSKINMDFSNEDIVPLDLGQFSCPLLPDEEVIMKLLREKQNQPTLQNNMRDAMFNLKQEVSMISFHINNKHL